MLYFTEQDIPEKQRDISFTDSIQYLTGNALTDKGPSDISYRVRASVEVKQIGVESKVVHIYQPPSHCAGYRTRACMPGLSDGIATQAQFAVVLYQARGWMG